MGPPAYVPHLAWCEVHQKKAFTKSNARLVKQRMHSERGLRIYPCGVVPNGWHVGHLPWAVRRGQATVDEVYGPPEEPEVA